MERNLGKYFINKFSSNLSTIIVTKFLHRESVKGKTKRIIKRFMSNLHSHSHLLCSSCRGQSCSKDWPCGQCESWSENQWQRYLSGRNTYQDRKDKKSVASLDSGLSLSMSNLTIQVTPKTFVARNKDGDQTFRRNVPEPQAS